ncbi:branched-chain amino acid ABC transporter permease [Micromonospora endolithica]|uniref:Branched-chain amino acid ABC transporter permease n=1 Tax=Micromonospora endolithica TaxID=230091 RepID=A0A3A9ZSX7_9ACTN|nr:branched-chain amino acid ABC transporter permease [Micromonospora endolithica]RKN50706.1 branched-chain amino acid ABC transporter permease [Micromonospora endolithica]TWJ20558.1 branched-chain amino acid transport system permease protein [Micromonospora endolithica]
MIDKIRSLDRRRVGALGGIGERWRALPKWQRRLAGVALIVFVYCLPWLGKLPGNLVVPGLNNLRTDSIDGGSNWAGVLFTCAVYVLVAVGLNVVIGLAGLLDLGYIGFFAIGAYSVGLFGSVNSPVVKWFQREFDLPQTWAVTWAICAMLALVLTLISGVLLGWPTLRLRGDYLAIVTLGFGEIIRIVARNSESLTNGPQGISAIPGPEGPPSTDNQLFGLVDVKPWYWLAITVVVVMVFAVRRLEHSRVGRAWLAVREDEDAAAVMGVYPFKFKLWAFAIGAALGGLAGMLFASRYAFIDPTQFNVNLSILFVAMVVVGGSGNMVGVSLGAVLLAYLPERFREIADYRWLAFGLAMVLVMILRPQGLIPSRRRTRELKDRAAEAEEAPAHV